MPQRRARRWPRSRRPEIVDRLLPRLDVDAARQRVLWVNPAGVTRVDRGHALITVAAAAGLGDERPRGARLTVPVAHDTRGGLVVYDLPSLAQRRSAPTRDRRPDHRSWAPSAPRSVTCLRAFCVPT